MKKRIGLIFAAAMTIFSLAACGNNTAQTSTANPSENDDKIQIVTTIYPEYDWVKNIVGDDNDNVEVTLLLDNGVDMHSFQPSAADMMKISDSDLFIYVGGESDSWVDGAISEAKNKNIKTINLLETLGDAAKEEEIVEGMQDEDEVEESENDETAYDEHVWLSLNNAKLLTSKIAETLEEIDSENADQYETNLTVYQAELDEVDNEYKTVINSAARDTILVADRYPFRYLSDDYHLNYYAAFVGCSAETEASFETITFLANKIDELDLKNVIILEQSDGKLATTVIENTASKNQKILTLNSMQSVVLDEKAEDINYISIMRDNLDVLKEALN